MDLKELLEKVRPLIVDAGREAEARHDSEGEYYMDGAQYEIMKECELLVKEIDKTLKSETI